MDLMFLCQVFQDAFAGFVEHSLIFFLTSLNGRTVGTFPLFIRCLLIYIYTKHMFSLVSLICNFTLCYSSSTNCRDTWWFWGNQWVVQSHRCYWWLPYAHQNPIRTSRHIPQSSQIPFHNFTGINLFFKLLCVLLNPVLNQIFANTN